MSIYSIAMHYMALLMFWVDNILRHESGLSSNILVVKSERAAARKLERTLPFSTGEKSKETTSPSSDTWVT